MGLGRRLGNLFRGGGSGTDTNAPETSRRSTKALVPEPASINAGDTIYAIGDIHGRADLLDGLINLIAHDMVDEARTTLVFLGDYVDRGEQSREVIDHCLALSQEFRGHCVFLKGNHEDAMLGFLDDPLRAANWLTFGGLATLMSYGVRGVSDRMSDPALMEARDQLAMGLPDTHLAFLDNLDLTYSIGSHYFCHAGIDPSRDLDRQAAQVLMWGIGRAPVAYEGVQKTIVHGHYVTDMPEVALRRVSVDTGAYFSGRLTALKLTSQAASFIHT